MAIVNFISTVWSENLLKQLDKKYIGVLNCNREFEGDIKNQGSKKGLHDSMSIGLVWLERALM